MGILVISNLFSWIPNSYRWNYNRSTPIPVWSHSAFMLGENRLSSCGLWFTVDGTWCKWYSSCLKSFSYWIPNSSRQNCDRSPLIAVWTPCEFTLGQTNCQCWFSVDGPSGWVIPVLSNQFSWIPNSSRWNCNRCPLIPIWTPTAFTVGKNWLSSCGSWF